MGIAPPIRLFILLKRGRDMNEKEIKVPFLLLIPVEKRGTAIEKLGEYQQKHYGTVLDIDLRAQFPEIPIPEIPTEELGEQEIVNVMEHNTDIKARMK